MSAGWDVVTLNRGFRKASLRRPSSKGKNIIYFSLTHSSNVALSFNLGKSWSLWA